MQAGIARQLEAVEAVSVGDFVGSRIYAIAGTAGLFRRIQNSSKANHPNAVPAMFGKEGNLKVIYLVPDQNIYAELFNAGIINPPASGDCISANHSNNEPVESASVGEENGSQLSPTEGEQLEL